MKIPHPALGKKFCTSGEFRLAKNTRMGGDGQALVFDGTAGVSIHAPAWGAT